MAFRDAFGGFTFAAFSAKNIPVVVAVMISPSVIESSMLFFKSKLLILFYIFLTHTRSFWRLILFFINLLFICSLGSVICKKYVSAYGKDNNYANAIDISITRSCGRERCRRCRVIRRETGRRRRVTRRRRGRQLFIL